MEEAQPNDSIWAARGVYYTNFSSDRSIYFELKNGVTLLGGFAGTETDLSQRDWQLNPTVFNGDIGTVGDSTDNSYTLLYIGTSDSTTVVDGIYFFNGMAGEDLNDSFHPNNCGGAVYIYGKGSYAYPKFRNCHFEKNTCLSHGGAVYINGRAGSVAPQFENCVFKENRAELSGGAIRKDGSSWIEMKKDFYGCRFERNTCNKLGGAICISEDDREDEIDIVNCEFIKNETEDVGGSLFINAGTTEGSRINILGCKFYRNIASRGAALFVTTKKLIKSHP